MSYKGVADTSPLGEADPYHAFETMVVFDDDDEPIVVLIVRTYDQGTLKENEPQGMGMPLAKRLHEVLGKAIDEAAGGVPEPPTP